MSKSNEKIVFCGVEKLAPRRKEMIKASQWPSLKVLIKIIIAETGLIRGSWLLEIHIATTLSGYELLRPRKRRIAITGTVPV